MDTTSGDEVGEGAPRRPHPRRSRCRGAVGAIRLLAAFTALHAASAPADAQSRSSHVSRTVAVMGTFATVDVWAEDDPQARGAAEAVIRELRRTEDLLSTWRSDTELSALNAAPVGEAVKVSEELRRLLTDVFAWAGRSGGAFHPAVGALVDAWDLRGEGRRPSVEELRSALAASGPGGFAFDAEEGAATRLREGAWMDAGAFGKGAALRSAADTLAARGIVRARVDLGGQLLLLGTDPVVLGVAHPRRRTEVAATLRAASGSVATSGQSERFVEVDGRRMGHIVDPRSGRPVEAWGSVTVLADDALVADILATALFVLGPRDGMELARGLDEVGVLLLEDTEDGLRASVNHFMGSRVRDVPGGAGSRDP